MFGVIFLALLTSLWCPVVVTLTLLDSQEALNSEYVQLDVARNVRGARDADDDFHLTITHSGKPMSLHYRRNKKLDRPFPVHLVGDNQRAVSYKVDTEFAAYQGVNHPGAVIIRENADKRSGIEVEGYIYQKDKWLTLQSAEEGDHMIHETKDFDESLIIDTLDDLKPLDERDTQDETTPKYIEKRTVDLTEEMNIEMRINFDYSLYKRWESRTTGTFADDAAKRAKVIESMKEYYVLVINAIDLRYRAMRAAGININIVVGGLIISETQKGSYWTEFDHINPNLTFSQKKALNEFSGWLSMNNIVSDHAQLHSARSSGGIAGLWGMCGKYTSVFVGNSINIVSAGVGAHELGHAMGMGHDPTGSTQCPGGAMMSSSIGQSGNWAVTSCSISDLRIQLTNYINGHFQCMKEDNTNTGNVTEFDKYKGQNLGKKYSPHQQCWLTYGSDNMVNMIGYGRAGGLKSICGILWCGRKSAQWRGYITEAFPHTPCGDKKWCVLGKCVSDVNAPSLDPYCPLGDIYDCWKRVNSKSLSLCYEGQILHRECCTSCKKNKLSDPVCEYGYSHPTCNLMQCYPGNQQNCCTQFCIDNKKNVPGCEWGDSINSCTKMDCYDVTKANGECCKSCAEWKTNVTDCPWGDRSIGCDQKHCYVADGLYRCCGSCAVWKAEGHPATCQYGEMWFCVRDDVYCYYYASQCCITCPRVKAERNDPSCEYGDRYYKSTCLFKSEPRKCYVHADHYRCCGTCKDLINGSATCQWGDKISGCTQASCNVTDTRDKCCETC